MAVAVPLWSSQFSRAGDVIEAEPKRKRGEVFPIPWARIFGRNLLLEDSRLCSNVGIRLTQIDMPAWMPAFHRRADYCLKKLVFETGRATVREPRSRNFSHEVHYGASFHLYPFSRRYSNSEKPTNQGFMNSHKITHIYVDLHA